RRSGGMGAAPWWPSARPTCRCWRACSGRRRNRSVAASSISTSAPTPSATPFGVYVHIPFCARRCDYCAFATWTDRHHLMADYAAAVRVDIERAVTGGMAAASSVFVGGGTPSLLPPELLTAALDVIPRQPACEVTVECNPETVTADLLDQYLAAGVTRISLGVQS